MKQDYMARLEWWARWMLPWQEAEDVIADYWDIAGAPRRPDAELLRDLGRPRDVVKPLAQPKTYRTWLAAFAAMAACILLPALGPWPCMGFYQPRLFGGFSTWELYFQPLWRFFFAGGAPLYWLAFLPGVLLPLAWFRRDGRPKAPLPRPIPIALAALLAVAAGPWWLLWQLDGYPDSFLWRFSEASRPGQLIALALIWAGFAAAVAGVAALVKARTCDRRWRAVYILALAAAMLCLSALALLTNMALSGFSPHPFRETIRSCLAITAIGLVGTGVALC